MRRRRMGRPGLVGTMARTAVVAGTASAVVGGMGRRQQGKANAQMESQAEMNEMQQQMAQMQAQQAATAPPPPPPAAAAGAGDLVGQLEKLASLHSSGLLSDDELAAAKAKLLA